MRPVAGFITLLTPAAVYFAVVFGTGFVFGTVRVLLLAPRLGVRLAELCEMPLMVAASFLAARWVDRRFLAARDPASRLIVGLTALAVLLSAEVILGVTLLGRTTRDVFLNRDPVSGTAYYLSLCAFALMPWLVGRVAK